MKCKYIVRVSKASSNVFLDFNLWICLVLELCLVPFIAAFSEECVGKLVHGVLLLYLVVSSALER